MQTARQRPPLTINAKASQASGHGPASASRSTSSSNLNASPSPASAAAKQPSMAASRNPYQTPQASTSNFALYQAGGYSNNAPTPITPMTPSYCPGRLLSSSAHPGAVHGRHSGSRTSILSDEDDDTYCEGAGPGCDYNYDYDYDYDKMSSSLYSDSSLNSSSVLGPADRLQQTPSRSAAIVFSKPFETLLINTYQNYITNPQITPFSGRYPPSGIVSKVSKESLKIALLKNVQIDANSKSNARYSGVSSSAQSTLLSQIRQKLIELCLNFYQSGANGANTDFSRNGSMSSLNSFNYHHTATSNSTANSNALDESLSNLSINASAFNTLKPPTNSNNSFLYFNSHLQSPQMSPVNHTFSPINSTFNNTYIPDMGAVDSNPANPASIHVSLNSCIGYNSKVPAPGSSGSNPPLTPITPIAAYSSTPFHAAGNKALSPTVDSFTNSGNSKNTAKACASKKTVKNGTTSRATAALHKPFSLSSPFKETFDNKLSHKLSRNKATDGNPKSPGLSKSSSSRSIGSSSTSSVKTLDYSSDNLNVSSRRKRDSLKLKRFGGCK